MPPEQRARARRLAALMALTVSGQGLLKTAQTGLFLSAWDREAIPLAFAASALLTALASAVTLSLTVRVGMDRVARGTYAIAATLALGLALLPADGTAAFATYVVVEALFGLLTVQVWSAVGVGLDPRSAKQLLPFASAAGGIAWGLAGLAIPLLVGAVGVRGLLVLGGAVLLAAIPLLHPRGAVTRRPLARPGGFRDSWRRGARSLLASPLSRVVLVLAVLAPVADQLVDLQLLTRVQASGRTPAELSAFFGRFLGLSAAGATLLSLLLASRLLERFGAARVLLVTPAVLALTSGLAVLVPGLWTVVLQRGLDRTLKGSLWSSSLDQLQTPLPLLERAQARSLVRGMVAPAACAVVALGLASLPSGFEVRWLALGALALALASLAAGTRLSRHYLEALRRAVDERSFALRGQVLPAATVRPLVEQELQRAWGAAVMEGLLATDPGTRRAAPEPAREGLARELAVERRLSLERLLTLLAAGDAGGRLSAVPVALQAGVSRGHVVELLELAAPRDVAGRLVPLFEPRPPEDWPRLAAELGVLADPPRDAAEAVARLGTPHLFRSAMLAFGPRLEAASPATYQREAPMLPLQERLHFLRTVPLFQDLSAEDLRDVAAALSEVTLAPDEVLFRQGDPGDALYLVARGTVHIREGQRLLVTQKPPEYFGELAVLDRQPRSADAVGGEPALLLRLKGADLHELLAHRPAMQMQILLSLVGRVREISQRGRQERASAPEPAGKG